VELANKNGIAVKQTNVLITPLSCCGPDRRMERNIKMLIEFI
jgi:hypothetical protein